MGRWTSAADRLVTFRSQQNERCKPRPHCRPATLLCQDHSSAFPKSATQHRCSFAKDTAINSGLKYGYARVSTDGQSVAAQVAALKAAGSGKVFREVASGAKTDRAQLRKAIAALEAGDMLMVTRLARSTRDLLNTLAAITGKEAGFRSLRDAWAETTTPHGRLMLTVLGGLAELERELIRARTSESAPRRVA